MTHKPRRPLTPEEKQLWKQVTKGDKKLRPDVDEDDDIAVETRKVVVRSRAQTMADLPPPQKNAAPLSPGSYVGIDRNTADRFRKGNAEIDGTLDLHGMNRDKAYRAFATFLRNHYERGSRALLIITGKGKKNEVPGEETRGILREMLPRWLAEPGLQPLVLAFDVAKQKHGGSGAYYILLKRKR